jgi:hypothetical protein
MEYFERQVALELTVERAVDDAAAQLFADLVMRELPGRHQASVILYPRAAWRAPSGDVGRSTERGQELGRRHHEYPVS